MPSTPKTKTEPATFEAAVERLETLIEAMESGDIPLAELVEKFEEGSKLLKRCQAQLKQAELKIEQLNEDSGEFEPFGSAPSEATPSE